MTRAGRLPVRWRDRLVGTLTVEEDRIALTYADEWRKDPRGFAISTSLPLDADFDQRSAHAFFANLLPEGRVRALLCRKLGISEDNDFALLLAIGGECAGALSIGDDDPDEEPSWERITPKRLRELASSHEALPAIDARGRARLSLAGAQDKLPVMIRDEHVHLPLHGAASTHILKFANRDFKHLPANEVLVTAIARDVGLPVVEARYVAVGPQGTCVVTRYDRRATDGEVERVHQEDFCQALGLPRTRKYESEGGPSFAKCVALVRKTSTRPLADVDALVRWLAFDLVAGNADAHAKNVSLLRHDDGWRLAPFYDLVCTRAYDRIDRNLAMRIGGEADPDRVRRPQIEAEARSLGVGSRWLVNAFEETARTVLDVIDTAVASSGVASSPVTELVVKAIKKQARRLIRELKPAT